MDASKLNDRWCHRNAQLGIQIERQVLAMDKQPVAHASTRPPIEFLAWIALGLISGLTASKIVNKSRIRNVDGHCIRNRWSCGRWLALQPIGHVGVTGLNLYSILVAVVGAVVVLIIYHALFRVRTHG